MVASSQKIATQCSPTNSASTTQDGSLSQAKGLSLNGAHLSVSTNVHTSYSSCKQKNNIEITTIGVKMMRQSQALLLGDIDI